jgi:hypothetical protein
MKPKTFSVELIAEHTHAGEIKQPGDKLSLPVKQAEWLMKYRIAKPAPNQTKLED